MSTQSVASTVIEAIVVSGPLQRRQTLRHTKKQIGLRGVGSDHSTQSSGPDSVFSNPNEPHQLVHKISKNPKLRHLSLVSDTATNTTASSCSSARSRREIHKRGGIPVILIPDRGSSSKPAKTPSLRSTSSRKTKRSASLPRSTSLRSAPLSQSSKFNESGYYDAPMQRTMSVSAGSGHSVRTIDFPPSIPTRGSSLSAPTSRNTSRAGSLTSDSLRAHNLLQSKIQKPQPETVQVILPEPLHNLVPVEPPRDPHYQSPPVDVNGDPFFGKRYLTQATPFSQASYETAGTAAEISDALAVSIFPHQNRSVHIVDQPPPSEPSPPANYHDTVEYPSESMSNSMTFDQGTGPDTPPFRSARETESPLRYPRAPPPPPTGPPVIQFIPPTPDTRPDQDDAEERQPSEVRPSTAESKSKRTFSLIRPFRSRRNSEPVTQSDMSLLRRTFSLSRQPRSIDDSTQTSRATANPDPLFPSVADVPNDETKLHPFWRPARFWDDLEDEGPYDPYEARYPIIDNRPKRTLSGKLKRTFAILPIKDDYVPERQRSIDRRVVRRSSSNERLQVVKQRSESNASLKHQQKLQQKKANAGFGGGNVFNGPSQGGQVKLHSIQGLGIKVQYVGFEAFKQRRNEKKQEQRKEKLRGRISGPREVQHGADGVLRGGVRV